MVGVRVRVRVRVAHCARQIGIQITVAALAGSNPAGYQPIADSGKTTQGKVFWGVSVNEGSASVPLLIIRPDKCPARTVAAAREQHTERAGFSQAADSTSVADVSKDRFGRCQRLDVNDMLRRQSMDSQCGHCCPMYR